MSSDRTASRVVEETGSAIIRLLRSRPDGIAKQELADDLSVSPQTIQRALDWLRDLQDAPLDWDKEARVWRLTDRTFTLPLEDPTAGDLAAVTIAGAMLAPIADDDLRARLERLIESMDARVREHEGTPRQGAVTATFTSGRPIDPKLVQVILGSIGKNVVRIDYFSPWQNNHRFHDIEPWQLRIHDGALYLRAWSRTTTGPRNFKVAQITMARVVEGELPRGPMPERDRIWGDGDPAFGIDEDRPGTATLRIRGGVARWVAGELWHPQQQDRWLAEGELLERRVAYRSCREFARRLLTLGSGLESIEPEALRGEVKAHARAILERLGEADA